MTVTPVVALPVPIAPLTNVTPFTYRDGFTFLERLEDLAEYINSLVTTINSAIDRVNEFSTDLSNLSQSVDDRIAAVRAELLNDLTALRTEVLALITESAPSGMCLDPTTGLSAPVSEVIGHVFDNDRYFGLFASQLDARNLTAAELDAQLVTARHADLNLTATVNDSL